MKTKNGGFGLLVIMTLVVTSLACKSLTFANQDTPNTEGEGVNTSAANRQNNPAAKPPDNPDLEKPDFTVTAEELDKEFTRDGVTGKDLEKYESKNIAVSGRVSTIVLEKKGTVQPWVTFYAPGILHGVSCHFDDDKVSQLQLLTKDKMAKVQGFQDDFIVPKISPKLKHCVVLETAGCRCIRRKMKH